EDTLGPMRRPRAGERDDREEDDQTGTREGHEPEDEHGEGAADGAGSDGYPPRAAGRGDDQRDAVRGSDAARRARRPARTPRPRREPGRGTRATAFRPRAST